MNFIKNIKSLFASPDNKNSNVWTEKEFFDFTHNLTQVIGWTEKLSENFDLLNGKYGLILPKELLNDDKPTV